METKELLSNPRYIVEDKFGIIAAFASKFQAEDFVDAYNSKWTTKGSVREISDAFLVIL